MGAPSRSSSRSSGASPDPMSRRRRFSARPSLRSSRPPRALRRQPRRRRKGRPAACCCAPFPRTRRTPVSAPSPMRVTVRRKPAAWPRKRRASAPPSSSVSARSGKPPWPASARKMTAVARKKIASAAPKAPPASAWTSLRLRVRLPRPPMLRPRPLRRRRPPLRRLSPMPRRPVRLRQARAISLRGPRCAISAPVRRGWIRVRRVWIRRVRRARSIPLHRLSRPWCVRPARRPRPLRRAAGPMMARRVPRSVVPVAARPAPVALRRLRPRHPRSARSRVAA